MLKLAKSFSVYFMFTLAAFGSIGYQSTGAGAHLGLNLPSGEVSVAFDFGGQVDLGFSLGNAGEIHFAPNIGMWIGGDRETYHHHRVFELYFDLFDAYYAFPIPSSIFQPYVGLGPMFHYWRHTYEYKNPPYPSDPYRYSYTNDDLNVGFNFFGGINFLVSPTISPYVELRGNLGYYDVFKMLAGVTFTVNGSR